MMNLPKIDYQLFARFIIHHSSFIIPMFYIFFTLLLACFYIFFMSLYAYYWRKLAAFQLPENYIPSTFVSVLIPARNEAYKIEHCLDSILKNNFPKNLLEIIVIDDHSEDDTGALVEKK